MDDVANQSVSDWGITVEEAQSMLKGGMCPICGTGPWKSALHHVSAKHAINFPTMREICGLKNMSARAILKNRPTRDPSPRGEHLRAINDSYEIALAHAKNRQWKAYRLRMVDGAWRSFRVEPGHQDPQ